MWFQKLGTCFYQHYHMTGNLQLVNQRPFNRYTYFQSQQWKHQKNVCYLFIINIKDTSTTLMTLFCVFLVNLEQNWLHIGVISFYVSRGNRGPKKPKLSFSKVWQIFLWHAEDAASVASLKFFKKYKNYPNGIVWSHFKANCMSIPEMAPANVFVSLIEKLYVNMYI